VSLPDPADLRRRRDADITRRRRHFDLHVRVAAPLGDYYRTLHRLDPARVRWGLPPGGLSDDLPLPRADRYDVALFDAFIAALPARVR
jgi:hypothetical protein